MGLIRDSKRGMGIFEMKRVVVGGKEFGFHGIE